MAPQSVTMAPKPEILADGQVAKDKLEVLRLFCCRLLLQDFTSKAT